MEAVLSQREAERVRVLYEYGILNTLPEQVYDRIVGLAAELCQTPVAVFSLADRSRLWFKAKTGMDGSEAPLEASFCAHALATNEMLIVKDATKDERFAKNPLVVDSPNIRFYSGTPVRASNGEPIGTLCVIDLEPRDLSQAQVKILQELGKEIEAHLELRKSIRQLRDMADERAVFSSMLAHDARNLLATIVGGLSSQTGEDDMARLGLEAVTQLSRMLEGFVEVQQEDFKGISAAPKVVSLQEWFDSTALNIKLRTEISGLKFESYLELKQHEISTDLDLLNRIVNNLIENSLRECNLGDLIKFSLKQIGPMRYQLAIEDQGPGIAVEYRDQVFEPYFSRRSNGEVGLGLGLTFCRVAVRALGGGIELEHPEEGGVRFLLEFGSLVD